MNTVMYPANKQERPKDIPEAISRLEIICEAEKTGASISEGIATTKERLDLFSLGLKSIMTGAVLSIILAPIAGGVITDSLPIFGSFDISVMDKILAYILSFGYSLAYMMLFIYIASLREGKMSSILSTNIITGMSFGVVIKFFIAVFIYGTTYFWLLSQNNIDKFNYLLVSFNIDNKIYNIIQFIIFTIKQSLLPTISIFLYTSIIMLILPWVFVVIFKLKNRPKEL